MFSYQANGFGSTSVSRENIWSKTTTALGAIQVSVGVGFLIFSLLAFLVDLHFPYYVRFGGIGMMTGCVIVCCGVIGVYTSKKRSKLMVTVLLLFSLLAIFCALFPMVIGIVGAHRGVNEQEGQSLLLPICQLVFSTVEIVVAAWSVGLCVQAMCCPNISLGVVSMQQPAGYGLSRLVVTEDGYHTLQPVGDSIPMAPHSQLLLSQSTGLHYVPIITTGGLLHGIQTDNHQVESLVPQTSLTSPILSPEDEPRPGEYGIQGKVENVIKAENTCEEEREDICLLP